jgi:hypothetical protein
MNKTGVDYCYWSWHRPEINLDEGFAPVKHNVKKPGGGQGPPPGYYQLLQIALT